MKRTKLWKIQFSFSEKTIDVLKKLKTITGASSFAEVLRNAIALYNYVVSAIMAGDTIQFLTPDGKIREVVFPFIIMKKQGESDG